MFSKKHKKFIRPANSLLLSGVYHQNSSFLIKRLYTLSHIVLSSEITLNQASMFEAQQDPPISGDIAVQDFFSFVLCWALSAPYQSWTHSKISISVG